MDHRSGHQSADWCCLHSGLSKRSEVDFVHALVAERLEDTAVAAPDHPGVAAALPNVFPLKKQHLSSTAMQHWHEERSHVNGVCTERQQRRTC